MYLYISLFFLPGSWTPTMFGDSSFVFHTSFFQFPASEVSRIRHWLSGSKCHHLADFSAKHWCLGAVTWGREEVSDTIIFSILNHQQLPAVSKRIFCMFVYFRSLSTVFLCWENQILFKEYPSCIRTTYAKVADMRQCRQTFTRQLLGDLGTFPKGHLSIYNVMH